MKDMGCYTEFEVHCLMFSQKDELSLAITEVQFPCLDFALLFATIPFLPTTPDAAISSLVFTMTSGRCDMGTHTSVEYGYNKPD